MSCPPPPPLPPEGEGASSGSRAACDGPASRPTQSGPPDAAQVNAAAAATDLASASSSACSSSSAITPCTPHCTRQHCHAVPMRRLRRVLFQRRRRRTLARHPQAPAQVPPPCPISPAQPRPFPFRFAPSCRLHRSGGYAPAIGDGAAVYAPAFSCHCR